MSTVHPQEAFDFLIEKLAKIPAPGPGRGSSRHKDTYGSDIWIMQAATEYWNLHGQTLAAFQYDEREKLVAPFYDATWVLCTRGILRPAAAFPAGENGANRIGQEFPSSPFYGDGYSLTAWGRQWIKASVSERPVLPSDPDRITEMLHQFRPRFGDGYAQRAAEAVADWRMGNYLSSCVMAGAAAESVLLAAAVSKTKDETRVLAEYRTGNGRSRIVKRVVAGTTPAVHERFTNALGILSYWRDDAGHGTATSVGEIEAYEALSRLLRLAQFTWDNWSVLAT
jgi:hypothetical protein